MQQNNDIEQLNSVRLIAMGTHFIFAAGEKIVFIFIKFHSFPIR